MLMKIVMIFLCSGVIQSNIFLPTEYPATHLYPKVFIAKADENKKTPAQCHKKEKIKAPIIKLDIQKPFVQGGSIIIHIDCKHELIKPVFTFNNKEYKLFNLNNGQYRGIVGISATTPPGEYTLKAYDQSGILNYTKNIKLTPAKFPIHNAKLAPEQSNIPESKEETEKIKVARNNISNDSYWDKKPFQIPAKGKFINNYGSVRYLDGKPLGDFHTGQDIKGNTGDPIVATAPGKVLISEFFPRRGGTVVIDHGQGLMSIYLHMSTVDTKKDAIVKHGEKIGEMGATGFTTAGSILHWAIYINGIPVNPDEWTKCK